MGLATTFLTLVGTLHSAISPDAVAAFADHLEHTEQRLADLEIKVTGKVAKFVEQVVAPPAPASSPAAPQSPAAAAVGAAIDLGTLVGQLGELVNALRNPTPAQPAGPGATPPAAPAPDTAQQG